MLRVLTVITVSKLWDAGSTPAVSILGFPKMDESV